MADRNTFSAECERSLQRRFRKDIWNKFTKGIKEYRLFSEGDRIAVCISGGKDSMLLAKLMQMLQRHSDFPFELRYIVMDPGYAPANRAMIEENSQKLEIPIEIFDSQIFDSVYNIEKNPCYLCARMRRGYLYAKAKELGCNKIALGHHYDDVIETILMSMLYGGQIQNMMPRLTSTNFEGMELIRPLYLVREESIIKWRDANGLTFLRCACRFTEQSEEQESLSKRKETKALIRELRKTNPRVEKNIFSSVSNVSLSQLIEYKDEAGERHNFLERFPE